MEPLLEPLLDELPEQDERMREVCEWYAQLGDGEHVERGWQRWR